MATAESESIMAPDPENQHVVVYWRPGCAFCWVLLRNLHRAGVPLVERNIWESDADAAFVRSVANGNETVPTVVVGRAALVNPTAEAVLARFDRDWEPPATRSAWLRRLLGRR